MNLNKYTINEIKKQLEEIDINNEIINKLSQDSRKGVQKLAQKYLKQKEKKKKIKKKWQKMNKKQLQLLNQGYLLVAGIDEAGRGPLAGPVVASAVILDPDIKLMGLDDSKKLTAKKRELLYKKIKKYSIKTGIGIIDNKIIDQINISQACFMAMKEAVKNLDLIPEYLLIDGNQYIPELNIEQEKVIDGDCKINCIAAASIIAKVTRDRIIDKYHQDYPHYGFIRNKGYGTSEHIQALKKFGPSPIHRYSYSVVKENAN